MNYLFHRGACEASPNKFDTFIIKTDLVESSTKLYRNDGANSSHHNFNGTINTINVDRLHKYRFSFMHIF